MAARYYDIPSDAIENGRTRAERGDMTDNDKRLIEDYLPIEAISAEASREKGVRKGHISTLHLWWARRPLVACRAAVYGALVPSIAVCPQRCQRWQEKIARTGKRCQVRQEPLPVSGSPQVIKEAQEHIAQRLTPSA